MCNMDDPDDDSFVEDLVDHPELAPPRRIPALELIAKWLAHAIWIFRERSSHEFPTRDGYRLGQEVGQRLLCSFRQLNAVGQRGSRPAARISSVTSSSV
jgi:hypothetical protein